MYTAAIEDITLLGGLIEDGVKSETLAAGLQVKQGMLVVSNIHYAVIPS
jgi:hypothetical protein